MAEGDIAPTSYNGKALKEQGGKWMEKILASEKREKDWRDDAKAAEKAYSNNAGKDSGNGTLYDFNILHSNVETIVPAIYNSTPVPDVRRRYVEAIGEPPQDPTQQILMQAAEQQGIPPEQMEQLAQSPEGQQMAQQVMQQPQAQQAMAQFQQAMQAYQAKAQMDKDTRALGDMVERAIGVQIDDNRLDIEIEAEAQDAFLAGRGIVRIKFDAQIEGDQTSDENLQFEAVSWRDYRQGPATRWENVPWIAFRHVVSRETLESEHTDTEMFASQSAFGDAAAADDEGDDVPFWEVWCKADRTVKFVSESEAKMLKETPDPLELKDFWPIPPPVQPITLTAKMTPVCPFMVYKRLADELDLCTKRINKIMKGLKVRGLVSGSADKIIELATAEDNEIVVNSDLEGLAQVGIDKAVLWWPVEQGIKVLTQLYEQREQIKSSIYEITGISDIVRGNSDANETLGAQEIKTKWGALRIQKMQRMIERQVRDLFGLMAEIITSGKFSEKTLYAMTGIEMTDGMRQLMQQPILASYRVDIESDSTVRADLTHVKSEMSEFLKGTAEFFGAMQPAIMASPQLAKPAAEIYSSFARVFKLGKQAEDALDEMVQMAKKAPDQDKPDPEAEKMQAEMEMNKQAHEQTMTQGQQKHAMEMERMQAEKINSDADRQAASQDKVVEQQDKAADRFVQQQDMEEQRSRDREQHDFKRQAHEQSMNKVKTEANAKATEAGLPGDEAWKLMAEEMQASRETTAQLIQVVADGQEKIAAAIEHQAEAALAPKRIIKDNAGRPVGVETVN